MSKKKPKFWVSTQRLSGAIGDSDMPVVIPGFDHSYRPASFYFRKAVWNSEYGEWEEYHEGIPLDPEFQTVLEVLVIE